ncbi:MAG: hypothetical protein H0V67_04665 [Geodermatophilaceae bacterium]|nr:hypothetical protein [Geodermatophilaceae bacterium]
MRTSAPVAIMSTVNHGGDWSSVPGLGQHTGNGPGATLATLMQMAGL